MAITTFNEFSTVAASNIDVNGTSIQGTAPVSNFDNALRELMAIYRRDLDNGVVASTKSANYTALANDNNAILRFSGAYTLSLTAAATLGSRWHITVTADGGDVIIDPNGAETINGATTITIPNGSSAIVWCTGSAFLASKDYLNLQPSVDVASAATTDIGATASQTVRITGTTTITSLGTVASGTFRRVRFAGVLTLTYNATSLILPGSGDITTAAGDVAEFLSEGSGNWRCVSYSPAAQRPYEQGTFTPTIAFGGASVGITYTTQLGRYERIGRSVFITGSVVLSNKGSSTGVATIEGLPFASGMLSAANVVGVSGFTSLTAGTDGLFSAGTTNILVRLPGTTGSTSVTNTNFSNTSAIYFAGNYSI